jgi:predicted small secreted protein
MKARVSGRGAALILLLAALMSMAGCNTVAGFGQDIHDSARTVQHAL